MKEIENLKEDMATLNQVIDLISNLKCSHQVRTSDQSKLDF